MAGTTGAGKSELLRTLVVGLAVTSSPDHLTFVLIDYKGGSTFDACARLPHVVGVVTDLDDHLANRALRCLHAELRRREQLLRDVGAADLAAYRLLAPGEVAPPACRGDRRVRRARQRAAPTFCMRWSASPNAAAAWVCT